MYDTGEVRGPILLAAGERVLLVDAKQRRYLITLRTGASFHTHVGIVEHDRLIGTPEGSTVLGSTGRRFLVVRPTLADAVLKMPRGAQVIYPKDLGAILIEADIAPGRPGPRGRGGVRGPVDGAAAGRGRGGRLRAPRGLRRRGPGPTWRPCWGPGARYRVELRDVYEGIEEVGLDRILLDLPEPWRVLPHAERGPAPRRDPLRLPAVHQPDRTAAGGHGAERVRDGLHPGGAAPDLAHRGPLGAARPPHGRATPGSSPPGGCSCPSTRSRTARQPKRRSWIGDRLRNRPDGRSLPPVGGVSSAR